MKIKWTYNLEHCAQKSLRSWPATFSRLVTSDHEIVIRNAFADRDFEMPWPETKDTMRSYTIFKKKIPYA